VPQGQSPGTSHLSKNDGRGQAIYLKKMEEVKPYNLLPIKWKCLKIAQIFGNMTKIAKKNEKNKKKLHLTP
jgi:hypothetical protein